MTCKPRVTIRGNQGNSIDFEINKIELTSNKRENAQDSLIIKNINAFLHKNNSAIVKNYWFLCDSSNIESLRNFNPKHKNKNIKIHLGKESVSIRPIPGTYKIVEGPFAQYKIINDSLGRLYSYVINVSLNNDFEVLDFHSILQFAKDSNGIDRVSFKRIIEKDEYYLIEDKKENNNWR